MIYKISDIILGRKFNKITFVFLLLFYSNCTFSQDINYEKLLSKIDDSLFNLVTNEKYEKALPLSKLYLKEAKKSKIRKYIGYSYQLAAYCAPYQEALKYIDSIFPYVPDLNIEKKGLYPSTIYYQKGLIHYKNNRFSEALDNYILAQNEAYKVNDTEFLEDLDLYIAQIRDIWGQYDESLKIYLKRLQPFNKNPQLKESEPQKYLYCVSDILKTFNFLRQYEEFDYYYNEGLKYSLKSQDSIFYKDFKLCKAIYYVDTNEYEKSLSLLNELPITDDYYYVSNVYFYKGKNYFRLKEYDESLNNFLKMDSLVLKNDNIIFPDLREGYEAILDIYRHKNDNENQFKSVKRLLFLDSILDSNNKNISRTIVQKYDTKKLIVKKEELISKLNDDKKMLVFIIGILILISGFLISYYIFKQKKNKKTV